MAHGVDRMSELPAPLVHAAVDLTDFAFMPLDVRRLRDSRIVVSADGEEFRAAILLWCAAWHQIPAASLPDDDIELANLAGYGRVLKEWRRVRPGALYGWIKCSDGRLYHPVVAEKARESWDSKLRHRYQRELERIKKHNTRHAEDKKAVPTFDAWKASAFPGAVPGAVPAANPTCPRGQPEEVPGDGDTQSPQSPEENLLKGQGEGQGNNLERDTGARWVPDDSRVIPLPDDFPNRQWLEADFMIAGKILPSEAHIRAQLVPFRREYSGRHFTESKWHGRLVSWLMNNPERVSGGGATARTVAAGPRADLSTMRYEASKDGAF